MQNIEPRSLIGTWRRFGAIGPAYQIISVGDPTPDGTDQIIKIHVAETGEEVDYTLNRVVDDEVVYDKAH
jgi:hypothetical protein